VVGRCHPITKFYFMGFKEQCEAFAQKVEAAPEKIVSTVAEDLIGRIVDRTPVESGALRNAWTLTYESDTHAVIENKLPYAQSIEHGHSRAAPQGMVAISVLEVEAEYPNIIIKANV
jgi:hypothetical protein